MKIPSSALNLLAFCLVTFFPKLGSAADFSATWFGGNGNWSDATKWDTNPNYPNNGNGVTYDATINSGDVTLDQDITIQRLFFSGGSAGLNGPSTLTLNEGLSSTGGTIGEITINLAAGSSSTISNVGGTSAVINNSGVVNLNGSYDSGVINNLVGATWTWNLPAGFFTGTDVNNAGNLVSMVTPPVFSQRLTTAAP